MRIETGRLLIRRMELQDEEALYEILSDEEVMHYIEKPFTREQTGEFIREAGMSAPPLVHALQRKKDGRVIGHLIYHSYDEGYYELGWILHRECWGQGLAQEITEAMMAYAKKSGLKGLVIECSSGQEISRHIALKNGFDLREKQNGCEVYRLEFGGPESRT